MKFRGIVACILATASTAAFAEQKTEQAQPVHRDAKLQRFTGRVNGKNVRLRTAPDVESTIVKELLKDELLVIAGEKNDFYAVEAPSDIRAYIFRSFVLDGIVEGENVNIRLSPDREAPVISHLSTGAKIEGKVCEKNPKWLQIAVPSQTQFYIAKEFVEYAGGPEFKLTHDRRKTEVSELLDSSSVMTQVEMRKPFAEMNIGRIEANYQTVITKYPEFASQVETAKNALSTLQETYLQKKIQYLESRAQLLSKKQEKSEFFEGESLDEIAVVSSTDKMKTWEPVEESLFLSWSSMHHAKNMDDFYDDQRLKATTLTGLLEVFSEPVHNKPGDYVLKLNNIPVAYLYSTQLNLQDYVGKHVSLKVNERPNNNFAHPAFYVIDVE